MTSAATAVKITVPALLLTVVVLGHKALGLLWGFIDPRQASHHEMWPQSTELPVYIKLCPPETHLEASEKWILAGNAAWSQ